MKRRKMKLFGVLLSVLLLVTLMGPALPAAGEEIELSAPAAVLMEASTGQVL